jgi:hypothetical protein
MKYVVEMGSGTMIYVLVYAEFHKDCFRQSRPKIKKDWHNLIHLLQFPPNWNFTSWTSTCSTKTEF